MRSQENKKKRYLRRKIRVRTKILGISQKPRLSVFRSNKFIYAQVIDDTAALTLAAAKGSDPIEVGREISKKALAKKIKNVVFDRGAFRYHGRVKALAEAARAGGLDF